MSSIAWKYPLDILHLLTYFKVFNEAGMGPSFIYLLDFHLKSLDSEKHFSLRLLRILRGEMWISSLIYGLHLMLSRGTLGSNDTSSTRAGNESSRSLKSFNLLKVATIAFVFKTLCWKSAKPWFVVIKLGSWHKDHKGAWCLNRFLKCESWECIVGAFSVIVKLQTLRRFVSTFQLDLLHTGTWM